MGPGPCGGRTPDIALTSSKCRAHRKAPAVRKRTYTKDDDSGSDPVQKSASPSAPGASFFCDLRCCHNAATIDSTDAASSKPEIGRVMKSQGFESVMIERTRLISIWSPRITPNMNGASGKQNLTIAQPSTPKASRM